MEKGMLIHTLHLPDSTMPPCLRLRADGRPYPQWANLPFMFDQVIMHPDLKDDIKGALSYVMHKPHERRDKGPD